MSTYKKYISRVRGFRGADVPDYANFSNINSFFVALCINTILGSDTYVLTAIVLCCSQGYIYWTEYGQRDTNGVPPRVCRLAAPSGSVEVLKQPGRNSWPNGLASAGGWLYFADGYSKVIERMNISGRPLRSG